ncbi:uncharacterized protein VICG_01432 [Vittaforma corneae ATCC 50505]|uniref:Transmembrane protein n=1 Tax=Vittaforma corneae (strain ATCC 50505) TaxID=993615 RepID=L2GL10_VITCO|nr:uncharacterized protein VICG_01432 [Vittaforma corneae ATCC 50505]ELA41568.1 hypothetical protein VICG_01432 [Vittaforma corneae ATCC 50505]
MAVQETFKSLTEVSVGHFNSGFTPQIPTNTSDVTIMQAPANIQGSLQSLMSTSVCFTIISAFSIFLNISLIIDLIAKLVHWKRNRRDPISSSKAVKIFFNICLYLILCIMYNIIMYVIECDIKNHYILFRWIYGINIVVQSTVIIVSCAMCALSIQIFRNIWHLLVIISVTSAYLVCFVLEILIESRLFLNLTNSIGYSIMFSLFDLFFRFLFTFISVSLLLEQDNTSTQVRYNGERVFINYPEPNPHELLAMFGPPPPQYSSTVKRVRSSQTTRTSEAGSISEDEDYYPPGYTDS